MDVKTVGSFYYENFVSTSRKIKQVKNEINSRAHSSVRYPATNLGKTKKFKYTMCIIYFLKLQ